MTIVLVLRPLVEAIEPIIVRTDDRERAV